MKRLFTTSALVACLVVPAIAQAANSDLSKPSSIFSTTRSGKSTATDANGYFAAQAGQILASAFIGQPVYNGPGNDAANIGTVNDVIIDGDGGAQAVVIGVGGFLGLGEKDVAVVFDNLSWVTRPDGKRWLMINATKEQLEKAPVFNRSASFAKDGAAKPALTKTDAAKPATTTSPGRDNRHSGMSTIQTAGLSAERLIGAAVFDADDTKIGSVGDVLMTPEGQTEAFVVDVGGFLGMGQKPVAVSIENLDVMADKDNKVSVYTQFTKDQLQSQTTYNEEAYKQNPDSVILRGEAE